tara:strand:+ start:1832 stop:2149 length:318 start_codon:yes stop_codon:yes gene_type:complete
MKYLTALSTLIFLNIVALVALIYFGNSSRLIEEENKKILSKISKQYDQLKINEVEYNIYNGYNYLSKLQRIYLDEKNINSNANNRLSLEDLENSKLKNVYTINLH